MKIQNLDSSKAIEEVNFIKEIIDKTTTSIIPLGKVLLQMGIFFLMSQIIFLMSVHIPVPGIDQELSGFNKLLLQIVRIMFFPSIIIITIFVFRNILKKNKLYGISKQILMFWLYIIVFIEFLNILLPFFLRSGISFHEFLYITIFQLFSLSFGLACITIFSRLRFPFILSIIYMLLGVFLFVLDKGDGFENQMILTNVFIFEEINLLNSVVNPICIYSLPATLIIVGIYLMIIKSKVI